MSIEFVTATPVKRTSNGGRQAEPNPFADVIKSIALQVDADETPVARAYVQKHTAEDRKKVIAKVRRQLQEAGKANTPPCSVLVNDSPVKVGPAGKQKDSETETAVIFWTVPPIVRERKPKADEATVTA
jgi:hypothetical protein